MTFLTSQVDNTPTHLRRSRHHATRSPASLRLSLTGCCCVQRPALQFQQHQAELKLEFGHLAGKLITSRIVLFITKVLTAADFAVGGHCSSVRPVPPGNLRIARMLCIDCSRQTVDRCRHPDGNSRKQRLRVG